MADVNIPVLDLPKPLASLLGTLLSEYIIKNWSIYPNKAKNTCVVIRFDDTHGCTPVPVVKYRRVSDHQAERNKHRAETYQQQKQTSSTTLTKSPVIQPKKRKIDNSPELCRTISDISEHLCIGSPELIVKEEYHQLQLGTHKEEYHVTNTTVPVLASMTPPVADSIHPPVPDFIRPPVLDSIIPPFPDSITPPIPDPIMLPVLDTITSPVLESPAEMSPTHETTPNASFLYPPEHISDSSDTQVNCPCCDKIMTVNHACDSDADESHDGIDMHKSDSDAGTIPAPIPTLPPHSSPNHPPERPEAAPPDCTGSTETRDYSKVLTAVTNVLKAHRDSDCKQQ